MCIRKEKRLAKTKSRKRKSLVEYSKWVKSFAKRHDLTYRMASKRIRQYVNGGNAIKRQRKEKDRITWRDHKKRVGKSKLNPDYYKDYWVDDPTDNYYAEWREKVIK
jgi:hypothetical protein